MRKECANYAEGCYLLIYKIFFKEKGLLGVIGISKGSGRRERESDLNTKSKRFNEPKIINKFF